MFNKIFREKRITFSVLYKGVRNLTYFNVHPYIVTTNERTGFHSILFSVVTKVICLFFLH